MAAPSYAAAGAGNLHDDGLGGTLDIAYPTGISAGNLLLLQVILRGADPGSSVATPAGWSLRHGPDGDVTLTAQYVFAKSAVGSESGSLSVTINVDTAGTSAGRMYRVTGWKNDATMANNFEGASVTALTTSNTVADSGVTTTAADRLAVNFVAVGNDNALGDFTGETGGDWTEAVAEYLSAALLDFSIQLQTASMASAGTVDGGTYVMALSNEWIVRGFAILPATAPVPVFPSDTPIYAFGRGSC